MKEEGENTKTEIVSIKFSKVEVQDFDREAESSGTERSKIIRKYLDDGRSLAVIRAAVAGEIKKQIGLYGLKPSELFDLKASEDLAVYKELNELWEEVQVYSKKSQVRDAIWRSRMRFKPKAREAKNVL